MDANAISMLVVEDSIDDAELLVREVEKAGLEPTWSRVESRGELTEALATGVWDVAICDYLLPGFDALEALRLLRSTCPEIPVIIVSGKVGEETVAAAMRAGASDYVLKGNLRRLGLAVAREVRERRDLRERDARMAQEERLRHEAELAKIELEHRWLSLPEGAVALLPDGSMYLNDRAAGLLGLGPGTPYRVQEIPIFRASGVHWASGDNPMFECRESGQTIEALEYQVRSGGNVEPVLANVGPLDLQDLGRGAIMLFQPTGAIRLLDSAKTDFMRVLAHELRHPLATAKLALDVLAENGEEDSLAATARRQIEAMDRMVVELTDIVGAGQDLLSIEAERVDLRTLLEDELLSLEAAAPAQTVNLKLPGEPCPVVVDRRRITSVVLNVLGNSARHAPPGTPITIDVSREEGFVRTSVVDEGPGIPPELRNRVFEKFYTGERRGSMGLGLYLSKSILEYHDGTIWYEDGLGICFRLPLAHD